MVALLAVMYFVPAVVAGVRGHPQTGAIIVLNALLGWTLVGWIIAMVWASTAVEHRQQAFRPVKDGMPCPECKARIEWTARRCSACGATIPW